MENHDTQILVFQGDSNSKVCAKTIDTLCKILKYLEHFISNGLIFTCYGFPALSRHLVDTFRYKVGNLSVEK